MKLRGLLRFFILLLVFLSCKTSSLAQNNSGDAAISGTIVDATGGAIGGVAVTATLEGQAGPIVASASSKADGTYRLAVSAGRYRVRFARPPFGSLEEVVDVGAGESRVLGARLTLERLSSSVVVTAQAQPALLEQATAPVTIISREEIDVRQSVDLTSALLFVPGVAIGRTGAEGGTASVFLNGGNSNFTKVLVDGTPINPPGSAVDFSSLTTENIDKVEIVRGAESAIYGSDAVSGVIQLFTHRGDTRIPAFSGYSEGGNFSSGRGGADLSGILGKFDYSGAAAYFQTDGQGPNDYFVNRTLSGNFGYSFSDTNQLHLLLRNNTSDAGIPGPTLQGPPDLFQGYGQKIFSANARWEFTSGAHWHHQLMGTDSYTRQHSFANQGDTFPFQSLLTFNRAALNPQSSYVSRKFIATVGYQYEVENGGITFISPGH